MDAHLCLRDSTVERQETFYDTDYCTIFGAQWIDM